mmetsp:Transcript_17165/g.47533  ORF Transcript_17165/g.47533 Transcript_17165/m.47533 type:complete len:204 (-) Transcript_17165:9-620(-)
MKRSKSPSKIRTSQSSWSKWLDRTATSVRMTIIMPVNTRRKVPVLLTRACKSNGKRYLRMPTMIGRSKRSSTESSSSRRMNTNKTILRKPKMILHKTPPIHSNWMPCRPIPCWRATTRWKTRWISCTQRMNLGMTMTMHSAWQSNRRNRRNRKYCPPSCRANPTRRERRNPSSARRHAGRNEQPGGGCFMGRSYSKMMGTFSE